MGLPTRPKDPARAAALDAGETFYENGNPCKYGHVGQRYTSSSACVQCCQEWRDQHRPARVRGKYKTRARTAGEVVADAVKQAEAFIAAWVTPREKPQELVTWGGPYPTLMSGKWK